MRLTAWFGVPSGAFRVSTLNGYSKPAEGCRCDCYQDVIASLGNDTRLRVQHLEALDRIEVSSVLNAGAARPGHASSRTRCKQARTGAVCHHRQRHR